MDEISNKNNYEKLENFNRYSHKVIEINHKNRKRFLKESKSEQIFTPYKINYNTKYLANISEKNENRYNNTMEKTVNFAKSQRITKDNWYNASNDKGKFGNLAKSQIITKDNWYNSSNDKGLFGNIAKSQRLTKDNWYNSSNDKGLFGNLPKSQRITKDNWFNAINDKGIFDNYLKSYKSEIRKKYLEVSPNVLKTEIIENNKYPITRFNYNTFKNIQENEKRTNRAEYNNLIKRKIQNNINLYTYR